MKIRETIRWLALSCAVFLVATAPYWIKLFLDHLPSGGA